MKSNKIIPRSFSGILVFLFLLILVFLIIYPLFWIIISSFKDYQGIYQDV